MPYYRLYHLKQNRYVGVEDFQATDDAQALRDSGSLTGNGASELWEGGRRIKTFPAIESAHE